MLIWPESDKFSLEARRRIASFALKKTWLAPSLWRLAIRHLAIHGDALISNVLFESAKAAA